MSYLISRSALMKEFETKTNVYRPNGLWHITGIRAMIEAAPTAYDLEAVVKELEKKAEKYMNKSEKAAELGEAYERHMIVNGAKGSGLEEAIEIIKEGMMRCE